MPPKAAATSSAPPARRKGACRMADIPPAVLTALNEGREQTITLVEWLAIDTNSLFKHVAHDIGCPEAATQLAPQVSQIAEQSITARVRGIGALFFKALSSRENYAQLLQRLTAHPADMARTWAGYAIAADSSHPLPKRLELMRTFAADSHMAVRECAWDALRPYLAAELDRALKLLEPWTRDRDPNVRRCAIEATRPRGVWCKHIDRLKEEPALALPLLENVRSDGSDYVRRSIANWLNDASKHQPAWVRSICRRWQKESPTQETAWIIKRALRTLNKPAK